MGGGCVILMLLLSCFLSSRVDMFPFVSFLDRFSAVARTVGHLSKSAEVMKIVNNLMKAPQMAVTMQEFSREMTKVTFALSGTCTPLQHCLAVRFGLIILSTFSLPTVILPVSEIVEVKKILYML